MFLPRSLVEEIPLPFSFPFLLTHRTSTLLLFPFPYLVDGPSTNAVYAWPRARGRAPRYASRFPLKSNTERSLITSPCGNVAGYNIFHSFLYFYSPIFVAYLSVSRTYKCHRPAPHRIIRSSSHQRPPFLSLSCAIALLFFSFPSDQPRSGVVRYQPFSRTFHSLAVI